MVVMVLKVTFPLPLFFLTTACFNLLPVDLSAFSGPSGVHFGYTVALWKDSEGVKRVVVGAPRDTQTGWGNDSFPLGSAYLCTQADSQTTNRRCSKKLEILPQNKKNETDMELIGNYYEELKNYGIGTGETIVAQRDGTILFVCSPRYPLHYPEAGVFANGACSKLEDPFHSISMSRPSGNEAFRNSLNGFSAALHGDNLVLGGPTAYNECGIISNCPERGRRRCTFSKFQNSFDSPEVKDFKKECSSEYEGWAVEAGRFGEAGGELYIAASQPKSKNYKGQINFYPFKLVDWKKPMYSILGSETGALFGYALISIDLKGDNVTDLLVSAPFASDEENGNADVGKVFIFFSPLRQGSSSTPPVVLSGRDPWGRFGTSMANLGDINDDIYEDIAIGAPYGGEDGGGVVHLYYGGEEGLKTDYSKLIKPSDYMQGSRGFGFSLNGGQDMDGNGYNDLVIGALHSDSALLIKASPVIRIEGSVFFDPHPVNITGNLCNLELPGQKKLRGVCFSLTVNLSYTSIPTFDELTLNYEMEVDIDRNSTRFGFYQNTDRRIIRSMPIYKGTYSPWSSNVFVQRARSNTNLTMRAKVRLSVKGFKPPGLPPVLDHFQVTTYHTLTQLVCENTTCHTEPDLALTAFGDPVTLGTPGMTLTLNVRVEVRDDPAYGIVVEVSYPSHLAYQSVDSSDVIPVCRKDLIKSKMTCVVEEGNANDEIKFWLTFRYNLNDLDKLHNGIPFHLSVNNDEETDKNMTNNRVKVVLQTKQKALIYPQGFSDPEGVIMRVNQTASWDKLRAAEEDREQTFPVDQLGDKVYHIFSLNNRGPSPVNDAKLHFQVPLYLGTSRLTYFMTQPTASDGVTCTHLEVNPLGLQSLTSSSSTTEKEPAKVDSRERRDVDETLSTLTTLPSTYYSTLSSSFSWTTDPADYFSTTYDPLESRRTNDKTSLECMDSRCTVTCTVKYLPAGESISVNFSSYLVTANLNKLGINKMVIRTWVRPEISQPGTTIINPKLPATTEITLLRPPKTGFFAVPLWILITASVVAVLVFLIIILALNKAGFFKRKRLPKPMQAKLQQEQQQQQQQQQQNYNPYE